MKLQWALIALILLNLLMAGWQHNISGIGGWLVALIASTRFPKPTPNGRPLD